MPEPRMTAPCPKCGADEPHVACGSETICLACDHRWVEDQGNAPRRMEVPSEDWHQLWALAHAVEELLDSTDRHKLDPARRVRIEEACNAVFD